MRLVKITLLVCLLVVARLSAQNTSQITGTVQDSCGLAVPGAQVEVIQTDTGLSRIAITGTDGSYVLPSLPVGPYKLEVKRDGFATFVQSGIVLQVDTNPTIQ